MATAGYSGTPLWKKRGIKRVSKLLLLDAPPGYFNLLVIPAQGQLCTPKDIPAIIHLFVKDNRAFEKKMQKIAACYAKNPSPGIWVSWYKKSAKIPTDITEDTIRKYALANGLVDVKVCAVNDTWSALKLVVPLAKL